MRESSCGDLLWLFMMQLDRVSKNKWKIQTKKKQYVYLVNTTRHS
ncbi:hypothetical protein QTP86_020772, partial [Hemibagrus guttatus]